MKIIIETKNKSVQIFKKDDEVVYYSEGRSIPELCLIVISKLGYVNKDVTILNKTTFKKLVSIFNRILQTELKNNHTNSMTKILKDNDIS